jgi:transposase
MSVAPALILRTGDRGRLAGLARLTGVPPGPAKRARMLLLAADGVPNAQIARAAGVSRPTVIGWRDRYEHGGIAALDDEPRSGRPPRISEVDVLVATLANGGRPPERLGITHWSARFLASELGISFSSVARIWRTWGIQPQRVETYAFRTDPELVAGIWDVSGLYLHPPLNAVVVSVGAGNQVEDGNWTAGLSAALQAVAMRPTTGGLHPPHRVQEFVRFLDKLTAAQPGPDLHVVLGYFGAHEHPELHRWLAKPENNRITLHCTPAGRSWLNLAEIFCGLAGAETPGFILSRN